MKNTMAASTILCHALICNKAPEVLFILAFALLDQHSGKGD